MRRCGNLFAAICHPDNLRHAWLKTRRGKARSPAVQLFASNLEQNLRQLGDALRTHQWRPGAFRSFQITDPKPRTISAAPLPDRVVHHAIMNVLDPIIDARLIESTFACRRGKGTHAAVLRAFANCQSFGHFLKLDVRKYFDSVNHEILKQLLRRLVKDPQLLAVLDAIIDSYHVSPGAGIPIGNLTSQYFANLYLSGFDHAVVHRRMAGCGAVASGWAPRLAYLRYMDDHLFFADDRALLAQIREWAATWLLEQRALALKPSVLDRCQHGVPFLGFHIKPQGIYLAHKSKRRYRRNFIALHRRFVHGLLGEGEVGRRAESLSAMTLLARARRFRNSVHRGAFLGHEPRQTRRELEQRRVEHAFGQPQQ